MSYEGMARSHVKELAREAFELDEVVVDGDGDLPFPFGTAMTYVSVIRNGRVVRVWGRAVGGVHVDKAVRREVNQANAALTFGRVWIMGDQVLVEGCLPIEPMRPRDLAMLVMEVGFTADRLGSMLAAVHGGFVFSPEGCDRDVGKED